MSSHCSQDESRVPTWPPGPPPCDSTLSCPSLLSQNLGSSWQPAFPLLPFLPALGFIGPGLHTCSLCPNGFSHPLCSAQLTTLTPLCCRYLTFSSAHHSYPLKGKHSDFPWAQPSSKTNQAGSQSLTSWYWARDPRHIQESQLWDFGELLGRAARFSGCAEMCTRSHEGRGWRWSCHRSSSRRRGRAWRPTLTPIFQVNDS